MGRKKMERRNTNKNKNIAIVTKCPSFDDWLWKVYSNGTAKGKWHAKLFFSDKNLSKTIYVFQFLKLKLFPGIPKISTYS